MAHTVLIIAMTFKFLTFVLDPDYRELRDQGVLVSLPPKPFDVLHYLIMHSDRMVTKSELLDAFWSPQVTEAALQKAISLLRKATRCDGKVVIRTYHGLGFRFVADLVVNTQDPQPADSKPSLVLQEQRLVGVLCLRFNAEADSDGQVMEKLLDRAHVIVEAHQGEALRMTLDGFTASFGLASHYEDAARRAVHCAVALIDAAKSYDDICPIIAIDHGAVDLSGGVEDTSWRRPSDIERGAVELANTGQPCDIFLSASTQHQLRDEVSCIACSHGFKLTTVNNMRAGVPARPHKKPTQFVGRSAEMAFLHDSLETLAAGNGKSIVLSGPAGIGKTRLLSEFLSALDTRLYHSVKLQCLPGLSNSPLAPIREMYQTLFSQAPRGTIRTDVDGALHAELLGEIINPAAALIPLFEHQRKQQSYALVNRMLAKLCADKPLVLVFEDIHWLDTTSRDYLDAMVQKADGTRLLLMMTTRPSMDPPMSETVIQLSPLGHKDGLKLLHDNISRTKVHGQVADNLVRRAAGNPFFIEELALALQNGGDPSGELPETVQAVISARISALDPAARAFLYVLAVIGPAARAGLVMHLLDQSADVVEATAARLRLLGFILTEPKHYSFRHMLINDTAYAMLAHKERQKLHGNIAAYLDSDAPNWTPRPETLAWHHQEAGQADRASAYWLKACRAAVQRFAHRERIVFAQKGLVLFSGGKVDAPNCELDLQLHLASGLASTEGFGAKNAGEAYSRARNLNETVGDPKANIRILVGLWIHAWVSGNLSQALSHAQDLLDTAKVAKNPALSLQAHASIGEVLVHKGSLDEALTHLTAGLQAIADTPPATLPAQNAAVACSAYACWTNSLIGDMLETKRFLDVSTSLAHIHKNPFAEAIHFALCSEPLMFMGQVEPCLDYADRAILLSREHDFAFWLGTGLAMRGWALGQLGQMQAAFEALNEGITVFEATGAGIQLANWYGLKAETLLTAGRFKEGIISAEHALSCAEKAGDMFFTPRIHTVAARLWTELNDVEKAADHAQLAKKRAAAFGMSKSVTTLLI